MDCLAAERRHKPGKSRLHYKFWNLILKITGSYRLVLTASALKLLSAKGCTSFAPATAPQAVIPGFRTIHRLSLHPDAACAPCNFGAISCPGQRFQNQSHREEPGNNIRAAARSERHIAGTFQGTKTAKLVILFSVHDTLNSTLDQHATLFPLYTPLALHPAANAPDSSSPPRHTARTGHPNRYAAQPTIHSCPSLNPPCPPLLETTLWSSPRL